MKKSILIFILSAANAFAQTDSVTNFLASVYLPKTNGTLVNPNMINPSVNGAAFTAESVIFYNTNTVTISNTAAVTSVIPNGIGTVTLPPNYFTNGLANGHSSIMFTFEGIYTTPAIGNPSVVLTQTFSNSVQGATTLATVTTTSLANSAVNAPMCGDFTVLCLAVTNGVGVFQLGGKVQYKITAGYFYVDALNNGGVTVTFPVTNALTFFSTAQWDSASTDRNAKITQVIGRSLN